jgi:hypothetical protein
MCTHREIIILLPLALVGLSLDLEGQDRSPRRRGREAAKAASGEPGLRMTRAVACRSIDGYENYEVLPDAALTSEEKLQVYYQPLGYKVVTRGKDYVAHFTQDGQIRRKGETLVLRRKKNILDFEAKGDMPPDHIFIKNSVPLKGFPPGEYQYDIILRDENSPRSVSIQSLEFKIIPPASVDDRAKRGPESEPSRRSQSRTKGNWIRVPGGGADGDAPGVHAKAR